MNEEEALAALRGDDPARAAAAERMLWQLWSRSGVAEVDALLRRGAEAMERSELAEAESIFTRVIDELPAFAEGWNTRATVRYLAENYRGSIADCREVLARKPHHFGAISGQGLCHMALGEHREAAALFRLVLVIHPHLAAARQNLQAVTSELVKVNGYH